MERQLVFKHDELLGEKQQLEKEIEKNEKEIQYIREKEVEDLYEYAVALEEKLREKKERLETINRELENIRQEVEKRKQTIWERAHRANLELNDRAVIVMKRLVDLIEAIDRFETAYKIYYDYIDTAVRAATILQDPSLVPHRIVSRSFADAVMMLKKTLQEYREALGEGVGV